MKARRPCTPGARRATEMSVLAGDREMQRSHAAASVLRHGIFFRATADERANYAPPSDAAP